MYYSQVTLGHGWTEHYQLKMKDGVLTAYINGQELESDPRNPNWGKPKKED